MTRSIFEYPAIPMSVACGVAFSLVVAAGIAAENRFVRNRLHGGESANNVIEWTLSVFSAFYGILLGLLAVGAYENINSVDAVVADEASAISVLYWNFEQFPEPTRGTLEANLRAYASEVVNHSFDKQARGERPTGEMALLRDISETLGSFDPKGPREEAFQSESISQLSDLLEAREGRLNNSDIGIPAVLWWIVGLGAAITLFLICLLDFPIRLHLVFGCLLAFFIGAMIYVIAEMDNPFSGSDRVGPERIQVLLDAVPTR